MPSLIWFGSNDIMIVLRFAKSRRKSSGQTYKLGSGKKARSYETSYENHLYFSRVRACRVRRKICADGSMAHESRVDKYELAGFFEHSIKTKCLLTIAIKQSIYKLHC